MVWAWTEGTTIVEESREQLWQQSRCGVDGADSGGEGEEQLVGAGGEVGDTVKKTIDVAANVSDSLQTRSQGRRRTREPRL